VFYIFGEGESDKVGNNSNCPYGGNVNLQNLYAENCEVYTKLIEQYEQRLTDKNEQIALLKKYD
jgi:hypothetical protein